MGHLHEHKCNYHTEWDSYFPEIPGKKVKLVEVIHDRTSMT